MRNRTGWLFLSGGESAAGESVQTTNGEPVGMIADVIFDWSSGQARFAVVQLFDNIDQGKRFTAIPSGFRVIGFFFNTTLAEALRRNEARVGRAKIPRVGVIVKFKRLQAPEIKEGFDQLWSVTLNDPGDFLVEPYPIPKQVPPSVEGSKSPDLPLPG